MNAVTRQIGELFKAGLNLFYPEICQLCRKERATGAEGFVCPSCWEGVRFITPPFCERCGLPHPGAITTEYKCTNCSDLSPNYSFARSSVVAKGPVLDVIHNYKYQRALWFEPFLADLLVRSAKPVLAEGQWDLIVPVPLHSTKQREREFNQAERLGRHLSKACNIPFDGNVLKRVQPTRTQTSLSREDRQDNVRKAFALLPKQNVTRKRIVLIDDVFTTGATTSACAGVLKEAGAAEVCVWTVARGT